jgi:hypothetical protein
VIGQFACHSIGLGSPPPQQALAYRVSKARGLGIEIT